MLAWQQVILWFWSDGDRLAWLARSPTGSEFGCSRRAILVEPQQTGWHSWQSGGWLSSEADIEGSEYTRLSCTGLDRLAWLAQSAVVIGSQTEVEVPPIKVT